MELVMLLAYFGGGAFVGNAIPHIANGFSGSPFHTPFAKPPGVGLSSPLVNVLWGIANLLAAYILLFVIGAFVPANPLHAAAFGLAFVLMGLVLARQFGRLHGGAAPQK